jgi:hypothetical protein
MRSATMMNIDFQVRKIAHQRSGGARMVQVDMRQDNAVQIAELQTDLSQSGFEIRQHTGRTGIDNHRILPQQHIRSNHLRASKVIIIDQCDVLRQSITVVGHAGTLRSFQGNAFSRLL